jgi:mRNA-degrading endonuclease RelE of RelBE toxin-antitoxin system
MKVVLSDRAIESLKDAPRNVQRAFDKQLRFLVDNLLHPSLHAKRCSAENAHKTAWDNVWIAGLLRPPQIKP